MSSRDVGPVTGVVGAVGGLGGFFPPLLVAIVKSLSGSYTLGFILLSIVAAICLIVVALIDRGTPQTTTQLGPGPSGTAATHS
jgi:nitrate/nitrite transporter NarK